MNAISPADTAWLLVSSALVLLMTPGLAFWGALIAFPLVVAGIALIHWLVAQRGWGRGLYGTACGIGH